MFQTKLPTDDFNKYYKIQLPFHMMLQARREGIWCTETIKACTYKKMPGWTVPTNICCLNFCVYIHSTIAKKAISAFYIQPTSIALLILRLLPQVLFYCVERRTPIVVVYNSCITDKLKTLKYCNKLSQ